MPSPRRRFWPKYSATPACAPGTGSSPSTDWPHTRATPQRSTAAPSNNMGLPLCTDRVLNRCARNRASRWTVAGNWISSTRRAPHDAPRPAAARNRRYRALFHRGTAAYLSLVSKGVGSGVHHVLPGDRTVSVDRPVDGILGRQLFLRPAAANEVLLGQPVCTRRGQRPGSGQPVYLPDRDLPPEALRETLSAALRDKRWDRRSRFVVCHAWQKRGCLTGSKNQCGAGWQPARRLVTAAGPPRRRQGPIANRPQVTNLPHKISSANRRPSQQATQAMVCCPTRWAGRGSMEAEERLCAWRSLPYYSR